ncbi:uncharacterized protein LOC127241274 [Andrographis paniculata]|uniref:uncharacterized protein LOC127241274 n=1 Tax=Andrographis paniculata TaxID=175694 RepID=UPI0021E71377|nr:uncharacterized protein LOC127241274 [Andrographis paniculata]
MKFEDLLQQHRLPSEEKQTKLLLQEQVERLQQELEGELQLNRVLQCAVKGPVGCCESCSCLSPLLPFKVQVLLAELSAVEEEIEWMESKINDLKLCIYKEKKKTRESSEVPQPMRRQLRKLASRRPGQICDDHCEIARDRRASIGSSIELQSTTFQGKYEEETRCTKSRTICTPQDMKNDYLNPNKVSVELIKCLIGIFMKLNEASCKGKGSTNLTKHTVTCMNSGLVSKAAFSCRTPVFPVNHGVASHLDPYDILPEPEVSVRDVGAYKNFIQITRSTLDSRRLSECLPAMQRLRGLMQKLSKVNLNYFTHKQKLAFWINVYNTSIMNAFLQHGLNSIQEKIPAIVKEAAINVGGIVLKASTIEHFILRHPAEVKLDQLADEEEMRLSQACGLDYPEPNVVFGLCRGSWSSPALRFYTADEVMNELEKAKAEYLEASVGITNRKKILVPKLVHWHMKDFADDVESLLEWIYSQLPYKSSLKRSMMECLNGESQSPSRKLVEIQPYASQFRYLIAI